MIKLLAIYVVLELVQPTITWVSTRDVEAALLSTTSASTPLASAFTNKKRDDNFFYFCGFLACLLHFIILRRPKPMHILLLLYLLCLKPYCSKPLYVCFLFDVRTHVECRTVLFNFFVIAEPLVYFCICHGTTLTII